MPFSNNVRPERMPGPINGNPANGLCERVCIQATKVFDACIKQETLTGIPVTLTTTTPTDVTTPFTFVSARTTTSEGTISNLIVTPLTDKGTAMRIQADVLVPLQVYFTDANGIQATGATTVTVGRDLVLNVPQASVIPYRIEAIVNAVSTVGTYTGGATFNLTVCLTVIIKVVTDVDLLIPSYGYCYIPPCQEFQQEVCEGFFDLPLFPQC
ncbi:MAG: hypothetical protein IJX70_02870 [Clostridia bacterium]|nr:hypothetical protein [Clostridia bacterium]